jgi:hypothetical protein
MKYVLLAIIFISCNDVSFIQKTYKYSEDGKPDKVIQEYSDSAAYLEAYKRFIVAKKVHQDMEATVGSVNSEPQSFVLTDSKGNIITESVFSSNIDSIKKVIYNQFFARPNVMGRTLMYDTVGLYLAPVKVLSAKFISKEYSNYKDIALRYKNVSDKTITAIRFRWYGKNAFDEPADMGGYNGWGGGYSDDILRPGSTDYSEWSILSRDGKKVVIAFAYEVVFEDGTKWVLKKK